MRRRRLALRGALALAAVAAASPPSLAWAAGAEALVGRAQSEVEAVVRESVTVNTAVERAKQQRLTAEQRVANGELLYRSKDYERAGVVFSEILEEYPGTRSYPDALWLRGETYYASKEYLSARRDYRQLVERGSEGAFQPYFGRALARLVDVCLRVGDIKGLDEVFAKLSQVPPAQVDASLTYAKGKAYYARADYGQAQQAFAAVPAGTPYSHQARYFLGLVAMRTAPAQPPAAGADPAKPTPPSYKAAIEAFRKATELPADTDDHRQVVDLSWMAIGRLNYEMESYPQAAEAYSKVGRDSREFGTMLYELAWVYVRLGDVQRAERALEVLQVSQPDSPYIADGTLLRADLLLRAGAFQKSLKLYEGVRDQYEPMRAKTEAFIDATKDPSVYYERLAQQQLDLLDQDTQLPPEAVRWAREAEDGPLAFAVIDDVNECKRLLGASYVLVDKLNAILSASNRVRAFPELAAGEERTVGLLNRIARARLDVARALDEEESSDLSGEIGEVRKQRRELMGQVGSMPTSQAEFAERDYTGQRQWNQVSQELSRRQVEVDFLQATVNGLRRVLKEDTQRGVARDPASLQRFTAELDANERELKQRKQEISEIRRLVDIGRAQVGFGDSRYQSDAAARTRFRDVLDREVQLAGQGQAGSSAQKIATQVGPSLREARATEDKLVAIFGALEQQVASRLAEVQGKIDSEKAKIDGYNVQLASLDGEAKDLVGQVAMRNFGLVRDKLRNIVLRADVGITEQAWEVREEELERVHDLQTERARQEQILDEELREVLDDAGESRK